MNFTSRSVFLQLFTKKYIMIHRLATLNDIDTVYELYMDKVANPYLTYDEMERDKFVDIYVGLLQTATLFVVELDHEIISTYRLIPKENRQAHTWYLGSFTIKNTMQGRGFGFAGIGAYKKIMRYRTHKKRIELTVDINNDAAIHLYKKAGFVIEGQIKMSYKRSDTGEYYDEFLMAVII